MSQERMTFMCGRNVLPKTQIEVNCVFSIFEGELETFSVRFEGRQGHGSLRADTPGCRGSLSEMKPCCLGTSN